MKTATSTRHCAEAAAADAPDLPLSTNTVIVWMSIAVILCCTTMSVPLIHLVPYAQSCGIPLSDAGGIILVMLIAGICGRVAFGKLADMSAQCAPTGWRRPGRPRW